MSVFSFLTAIEKAGSETEKPNSRREAFRMLGGAGKQAALAALPFGLSGVFTNASAKPSASYNASVLQLGLKLEYLESEFYKKAVEMNTATTFFPSVYLRMAVELIRDHELAHVNLLKDALTAIGETPAPMPVFDFTAGGQFPNVFTDYTQFLLVAQALEDAGVSAYKEAIKAVTDNRNLLQKMIAIHATEARHASQVRQMRRATGATNVKPWITGNTTAPAFAPIYAAEDNTVQAGVDVATVTGAGGPVGAGAAAHAFDEPISLAEADAILSLFIA